MRIHFVLFLLALIVCVSLAFDDSDVDASSCSAVAEALGARPVCRTQARRRWPIWPKANAA